MNLTTRWFPLFLRLLKGQSWGWQRFNGGIHPPQYKLASLKNSAMSSIPYPVELVLPLVQYKASAAKPVVRIGDHVQKYQLLADAPIGQAVPLHAPTSGIITAIEKRTLPLESGLEGEAIILQPDGHDTPHPDRLPCVAPEDAACLVQLFHRAGLVGMGGAGFPSARKILSQAHIHTLIVNGAECEPFITCDDHLMQTDAESIVKGAQLVANALNLRHVYIGIENNKTKAITAMTAAASIDNRFEIKSLPTVYPMGSAKQLIEQIIGYQIPANGHATDLGLVMFNVATCHAVNQAVEHGLPLTERWITVAGTALDEPKNIKVPLGTHFHHLVQHCRAQPTAQQLPWIMGGPMMGWPVANHHVPVLKTTNCILVNHAPSVEAEQNCIRCGECMNVCPMGLMPQQLGYFSKGKQWDKVKQFHVFNCIECGACDYVCPSHIPLSDWFKHAKGEIKQAERLQHKADQARQRHENRIARQEQEKAEKQARMAEKKRLAAEKAKALAAAETNRSDSV